MTRDMLNTALRTEIIHYRETDEITVDLKSLLMTLILEESEKQLQAISPNIRIRCESEAYLDCCKNSIHFDPKLKLEPTTHIGMIIRCAFNDTMRKEGVNHESKNTEKN